MSLKRASSDWDVQTTIWLGATGTSLKGVKFIVTSAPGKETLTCNKECATGQCKEAEPAPPFDEPLGKSNACRCIYMPTAGRDGADAFYYAAQEVDPEKTPPAPLSRVPNLISHHPQERADRTSPEPMDWRFRTMQQSSGACS